MELLEKIFEAAETVFFSVKLEGVLSGCFLSTEQDETKVRARSKTCGKNCRENAAVFFYGYCYC
jgi:hypothetical protein